MQDPIKIDDCVIDRAEVAAVLRQDGRVIVFLKSGKTINMRERAALKLTAPILSQNGCVYRTWRSLRVSAIDLTGRQFGRLTVIERSSERYTAPSGSVRPLWVCRCTCGETCIVASNSLLGGGTRSCGCLRRENAVMQSRKRERRSNK